MGNTCFDQPDGTRVAKIKDFFFKDSLIDALPGFIKGAESGMVHAMRTFTHMNEKRFAEAINEGRVFINPIDVLIHLRYSMALTTIEAGCYQQTMSAFIKTEHVQMDAVRKHLEMIAPKYISEHSLEKIMTYLHVALVDEVEHAK